MYPPYCAGGVGETSRAGSKRQGIRSESAGRFGWFVGDNMGTAGIAFLLRAVAFESTRVLRPSGSLLCFLDWRQVPNVVPAIESAGLRYQNLLVWDKGSMGLGLGFRASHELVAHFSNGSPRYHARDVGNVLRVRRVSRAGRDHQTQKPTELLRALLRVVVPPGGTVVDPFCGSGSTLVAAAELGMGSIGFDRDGKHVRRAAERVEAAEPLPPANEPQP
jgi:site-specific DNA-methyltransferase (adenine-specific)